MKTIHEVSKIVAMSISTLHYYEREKMIQPYRGKNNYRYYTEKNVRQLKLIKVLRQYHFSIEEIRCILKNYTDFENGKDTSQQAITFFEKKLVDIHQIILGYETLIQLINHLPLMNGLTETTEKTRQTEELIDRLFEQFV